MERKIALVADKALPELISSDIVLMKALNDAGYDATRADWDDESIEWEDFDAVILRACWNYHTQIDNFYAWLDKLVDCKVQVYNPIPLVRWNSHKKYLLDLQSRGLPITPTTLITKDDPRKLKEVLASHTGEEFVVKPCFGADAYGVMQASKSRADASELAYRKLVQRSDVLVQQFIPEIKDGEVSAVFLGGKYSHSVLKVPKPDDFRSNYGYGGTEKVVVLEDSMSSDLQKLYGMCDVDSLYARFDFVRTDNGLLLMELELIEPYLFLDFDKHAAERFVEAFRQLG